jgi:hypothetical protein
MALIGASDVDVKSSTKTSFVWRDEIPFHFLFHYFDEISQAIMIGSTEKI